VETIISFILGCSLGSFISILFVIAPRIDRIERILHEHGIDDDGGLN